MTTGRAGAGAGVGAMAGSPPSAGHTASPSSTVSGISAISRASTALLGFTGSVPGRDIWGASAGDKTVRARPPVPLPVADDLQRRIAGQDRGYIFCFGSPRGNRLMPIRGEDHHPTLVLNWAMMPIKFGVGALPDVSATHGIPRLGSVGATSQPALIWGFWPRSLPASAVTQPPAGRGVGPDRVSAF